MGVGITIFMDSLRHAWRFRLPVVFFALSLIITATLPRFTLGDGSLEGQVRLYLLYGGHLALFSLSFFSVAYSVWFEHQERVHHVHLLLHTRPIHPGKLIFWKIIATMSMLFSIVCSTCFVMFFSAMEMIDQHDSSTEAKQTITAQLLEIRGREFLNPLIDSKGETKRLERKNQNVLTLEANQPYPFSLPSLEQLSQPVLEGKLLSLSDNEQILLRIAMVKDQRLIWGRDLNIISGQPFSLRLPKGLSHLKDLSLSITQVNASKSALYLPLSSPLSITHPKGMWWSHLLKASLMITLLLGTLITLSLFSAQILSAQGSLLLIFLIYLVGSFQTNIEHLLFPAPPVLAGMPQVEPSLGFSEVITTAIWKPLLWLVPDFQNLNPINSLMNGEFISWSFIWEQGISIGPFLAICSFYLIYFLPKRERAIDR